MRRVVLGFSGGVDSSVAAALLREAGWEVLCLYLETGSGEEAAARAAADALGLPLAVYDARAELEKYVCAPFAAAYARGETPSPCVMCNPSVKLRLLLEYAGRQGAEAIATGHYARAEGGALYMGRLPNDQSYMLCRILPEQRRRLLLPLGGYEKREVRALAAALGLPSAQKDDSMELCFVPDGDFAAWIERRGGRSSTAAGWSASTGAYTATRWASGAGWASPPAGGCSSPTSTRSATASPSRTATGYLRAR